MAAVVLIATASERNYHVYAITTTNGPYVVIFFSPKRLDQMIGILSEKLRGQDVRLSHLHIPYEDLKQSIEHVKEIASPINVCFVADTDPLAAKLMSATRALPRFDFWMGVRGE